MSLVQMTNTEFDNYLAAAITDYTHDLDLAGGLSTKTAQEIANSEFGRLLPNGLATKNHRLMKIIESGEAVGYLWLFVNPTTHRAFVYDISIDEPFRRRGYAKAALEDAEKMARGLGAHRIGLHVFGFNQTAQHLYQELGYRVTDLSMQKEL